MRRANLAADRGFLIASHPSSAAVPKYQTACSAFFCSCTFVTPPLVLSILFPSPPAHAPISSFSTRGWADIDIVSNISSRDIFRGGQARLSQSLSPTNNSRRMCFENGALFQIKCSPFPRFAVCFFVPAAPIRLPRQPAYTPGTVFRPAPAAAVLAAACTLFFCPASSYASTGSSNAHVLNAAGPAHGGCRMGEERGTPEQDRNNAMQVDKRSLPVPMTEP